MSIFESAEDRHLKKLEMERIFEQVAEEVRSNQISQGLWAKAFADCDGDEQKARALYMNFRAEMLKSELEANREMAYKIHKEKERLAQKIKIEQSQRKYSKIKNEESYSKDMPTRQITSNRSAFFNLIFCFIFFGMAYISSEFIPPYFNSLGLTEFIYKIISFIFFAWIFICVLVGVAFLKGALGNSSKNEV